MNYTGMYNTLIVKRNEFIEDASRRPLNNLEADIRLLEAERKLYSECRRFVPGAKYPELIVETDKQLKIKRDELKILNQRLDDARSEINVLNKLIEENIDSSNE